MPASASTPTTPTATTSPPPPPATATAKPAATPPPTAARVVADPPTKVQITRWGSPTTKPKETVNLDQSGCTTSNLLTRQDALRCFTTTDAGASIVEDPCFDLGTGEGLMCPSAPWSTGWIEISAQGNSGNTDPPTTKGSPWGVEIASGVRCLQASGATGIISGLRGSYYCPDDSSAIGTVGTTGHVDELARLCAH